MKSLKKTLLLVVLLILMLSATGCLGSSSNEANEKIEVAKVVEEFQETTLSGDSDKMSKLFTNPVFIHVEKEAFDWFNVILTNTENTFLDILINEEPILEIIDEITSNIPNSFVDKSEKLVELFLEKGSDPKDSSFKAMLNDYAKDVFFISLFDEIYREMDKTPPSEKQLTEWLEVSSFGESGLYLPKDTVHFFLILNSGLENIELTWLDEVDYVKENKSWIVTLPFKFTDLYEGEEMKGNMLLVLNKISSNWLISSINSEVNHEL